MKRTKKVFTRAELFYKNNLPVCLICCVLNGEPVQVDDKENYLGIYHQEGCGRCTPIDRASLMIQWDQYKTEHSRSSIYGK